MNAFRSAHVSIDGEIVGVAACVDNVVAAFQYGASVLEIAKQHRARNGEAPLPKWLEDSVRDAPAEIEHEKRRGIERFDKPFEIGDDQAIFELQQITIQLQRSLLMKINNVKDHSTDYKALACAADQARDGTITTLMSLRKRLQQAEMESDMSGLRISTALPPPPPIITDAREITMSPTSHTEVAAAFHRDSLPVQRHGPHVARNSLPAQRESYGSRHDTLSSASSESSAQRRRSTVDSTHSESQPMHMYHPSEPVRAPSMAFTDAPRQPFHAPSMAFTDAATEPVRAPSTAFASPPARPNMPSSQLAALPKPDRKNNYLNFCKCAWKLQGGDEKAFIKSKDWTQRSASSTAYSLACTRFKCEFKSPYKSAGNPNVIWNRLVVDDEHGIKYRWSFLAKSHVQQKNVVKEDYSYQCQFCVFMGMQVPVMNLAMLLEHISVEHRRHPLSDVILDRTSCVNDRICRDGEKFDINLYPAINGVEADAFISPVLGDVRDLLMRPVQPVEKWSEGKQSVFELHA